MSKKLERLVEEYRKILPEKGHNKEKAKLEHDIWGLAKYLVKQDPDGGGHSRRTWLRDTFGTPPGISDHRVGVYVAGAWAHSLFDLMDEERISTRNAAILLRKTKKLAKKHSRTPGGVFKELLAQYDGTLYSIENAVLEGEVQTGAVDLNGSARGLTLKFKSNVRHLAHEYVKNVTRKVDLDVEQQKKLMAQFSADIDQVLQDLVRNVNTRKQQAKEEGLDKIGSSTFYWACEVLGISGTFGKDIDLQLVGKQTRIRARDLHPDRNNNPSARVEYENVTRASEILHQYSHFCRKKGENNGESSTNEERNQAN